jgi:hypothetical protein
MENRRRTHLYREGVKARHICDMIASDVPSSSDAPE